MLVFLTQKSSKVHIVAGVSSLASRVGATPDRWAHFEWPAFASDQDDQTEMVSGVTNRNFTGALRSSVRQQGDLRSEKLAADIPSSVED